MTHVLIVEDDAAIRDGLAELLELEGYTVSRAIHGRDSLNQLQAGLRPDAIVLDIVMPVMDGLTATREILALPEPPQVAVLTTFHVDEYVYAALAAGARTPEEVLAAAEVCASQRTPVKVAEMK